MLEETLVFIDEGFLSKLSKHLGKGNYIKIDIVNLSKQLAKKQNLFLKHLYYATAPPYQSSKPTKDEKKRKEGYDKFKNKLSKIKEVTILEGRCQRTRNEKGTYDYRQKGVDTVLTMALSSFKIDYPTIKQIILIASDSDFVPVIKMLKQRGIEVILYTYYERKRNTNFSRSNHLINECTKVIKLSKSDLERARRNTKNVTTRD